jgi:hypothetical protein
MSRKFGIIPSFLVVVGALVGGIFGGCEDDIG